MTMKSFGIPKLGVVVLAASLLSGCSTVADASSTPLLDNFEADIQAEVVLTVNGVDFTLEQLAERKTSEIEILEPFSKEQTSFTVVDFDELLIEAGFEESDRVETIALNDYRYSDTVANFAKNDSWLAIYESGEAIPVAKGGPVRIIFSEDSEYYGLLDAWNWSLRSIEAGN